MTVKTYALAACAAVFLAAPVVLSAKAPHGKALHAKPAAKAAPLICPVTGEEIGSIQDAAGHSVYQGKTYYFCCAGCKPMFDKDPAKYVHPARAK